MIPRLKKDRTLPRPGSGYSSHRLLEARSLAMHAVIAAKIERDPKLLDISRRNLKRWRASSAGDVPVWLEEWTRIMKRPWREIAAVITEPSEEGARLRQSSPFAGVLTQSERRRIYDAFALEPDSPGQRKRMRDDGEAIAEYNDRVAKSGTFSTPKE